MPEISVIVPVYKAEMYLASCLDSILSQTFTDYELILVDDGSPDSSGKICDDYAEKSNKIIVIHKENGGAATARNVGLDNAKGKYIAFIDCDDIIHPQYLEFLYSLAEKNGADIAMGHYDFFTEEGKWFSSEIDIPSEIKDTVLLNGAQMLDNFIDNYHRVSLISMCMKIYKKEIFNNVRIPEGHIEEDSLVLPLILENAEVIVRSELKLYHWRETVGSVTRSKFNKKTFDYINVRYFQAEFFEKRGNKKISDYFKKQFMRLVLKYYYKTIEENPDIMEYLKPYLKIYKKKFIKYFCVPDICINERIAYVIFLFSPKFARRFYNRVYTGDEI